MTYSKECVKKMTCSFLLLCSAYACLSVSVLAGMYMGATQMGYVPAAGYGQYQALAAQQGMMGPMMAPQMNIVGQAGVMPQTGVPAAPPYMAGVQGGVIGMQNGMMGSMAAVPQQAYGAQQMQWNISQVTNAGITMAFFNLIAHIILGTFYSNPFLSLFWA